MIRLTCKLHAQVKFKTDRDQPFMIVCAKNPTMQITGVRVVLKKIGVTLCSYCYCGLSYNTKDFEENA